MFEYAISVLADKMWFRKEEAKSWKKRNEQQFIINKNLAKECKQAISILEKAGEK